MACVRNESLRLPFFLQYYRALGVTDFLFVDNGSDDGTLALLSDQPDVSLWSTDAGYKAARFGLDWVTWLQMRYASGKWCLTVDADELLVFSGDADRTLSHLTEALEAEGQIAFGALMLDLYSEGPVGGISYVAGQNPLEVLTHFDAGPYRATRQMPKENLWVLGGVRERVFFPDAPERGPTLNKLPLVKWNWRYAYVNSTHAILPRNLNRFYDGPGDTRPCGVLLHTKFLADVIGRSCEEKQRKQHFHQPEAYADYYDHVAASPTLCSEGSIRYEGADQLIALGLMSGERGA
ncbi:glycosyltransferase family 2 protein [Celeribacter litoreus]|uniref:glycosyltransferase family 2 protein n=1 Tax=Celeribacter litoreus TaxID=2876714 RepID=UPI0029620AB1|nr:glycosyltransferase family 2 protein [Celeribacter litoreus]